MMIIYSNFSRFPKKSRKEKLANALLYIIFGLLFMFLSKFIVSSFALIIGIVLILFGVYRLIFGITYRQTFDLVFAILLILFGIIVTTSNQATINFLTFMVSFGAIMMGINRIFFAFMIRQVDRYWYVNLGVGILIGILGILMATGQFELNVIIIILGAVFTIYGITKLISTLMEKDDDDNNDDGFSNLFQSLNKDNKKKDDDVIDVEFKEKNDQDDRF